VQKKVKGGKDNTSEFKSWATFEKEMKYIWNNAWKYNEDGSEISVLAKNLQVSKTCELINAILTLLGIILQTFQRGQTVCDGTCRS
jgi:hypothetical protein